VLVCQRSRPGAFRSTLLLLPERGCALRALCIWASRVRLWDGFSQACRCVWPARSISLNWDLFR
jgi:hypothetical protein